MLKTVACALDFILDTLDYSPDEPSVPAGEADLRLQPSADPIMKNRFCVVLWEMRNTPSTTPRYHIWGADIFDRELRRTRRMG